ncbi:MAG: thiamine-phosphate synthase family protein [candidate division WOR-3 bacterium]|jgi:hydroxymethylpyrimidine/phosphomethylpyrimidine kinase
MVPEAQAIRERLEAAVVRLEQCPEFVLLVPEVRSNIVYALPVARSPADVAGVDGRITVVNNLPRAAGPVRFGASDHLARLVIELQKFDPGIRSALNFRWNEMIHQTVSTWAEGKGITLGVIDRAREPEELIGRDGMSVSWKVQSLLANTGGVVPEVFYETRGWGKEPLFLLVGPDPVLLVERVMEIARLYARAVKK